MYTNSCKDEPLKELLEDLQSVVTAGTTKKRLVRCSSWLPAFLPACPPARLPACLPAWIPCSRGPCRRVCHACRSV